MDMFDSFMEKAKGAYDVAAKKTGELVEISKIKLECVKVNNEIKRLYEKLGSAVYSMVKANFENQDVIDSITEEIDESLAKLSKLNEKLSDIKNINICSVCGCKNPEDNYYCSKCGTRIKSEFAGYQANTEEDEI